MLLAFLGRAVGNPIIDLPDDFELHGIGVYEATVPVDIRLDDEHDATDSRQATVIVNRQDIPIVLVLAGDEPTVWKVGYTEGTRIAGVIVSGDAGQALIGIDESTSYELSSQVEGGLSTDRGFPHFGAVGDNLDALKNFRFFAEAHTGGTLEKFHPPSEADENGTYFIGERVDPAQAIFSDFLTLEGYRVADRPLSPHEYVQGLLDSGKIRPATDAEEQAWIDVASAPYRQFNPDLEVEAAKFHFGPVLDYTSYVVQEAIVLSPIYEDPPNYIVPAGVPRPIGDRGFSGIFYMDDGSNLSNWELQWIISDRYDYPFEADLDFFEQMPESFSLQLLNVQSTDHEVNGIGFGDSGRIVTQAEVVVNSPELPVVLVLSSSQLPIVWRVQVTEGTEVAGVILSTSEGTSTLIGLPKDVPTYAWDETRWDPSFFNPDAGDQPLLEMNARLKAASGKDMDAFAYQPNGVVQGKPAYIVGEPLTDNETLLFSDERTLDAYVLEETLLPPNGPLGLRRLVADGKIRPATLADIETWLAQEAAALGQFAEEVSLQTYLQPTRTYVVLEEMILPETLNGAGVQAVIIPKGVPEPFGTFNRWIKVLRVNSVLDSRVLQLVVDFKDWEKELLDSLGNPELEAHTDTDGDGASNTMEFMMGTDPQDRESADSVSVSTEQVGGEAYLKLELPLRKNGFNITGVLERSADGLLWSPAWEDFELIDRTTLNAWSDKLTLRSLKPIDAPSLFRLRATILD